MIKNPNSTHNLTFQIRKALVELHNRNKTLEERMNLLEHRMFYILEQLEKHATD